MLNEIVDSLNLIIQQTKANAEALAFVVAIPWIVYGINVLWMKRLFVLGIVPRHWVGLPGILCAPFLHADFNHLFFNTIPLAVLANFILIQGLSYFLTVTLCITVISGLLTWCLAKPGVHIGASGLITGYWALLVSDIVQQGSVTAIILGVVSVYYFAGIFLSVFPGKKGVSWEGHLFGLIAGFFVSYLFTP